MAAPEHDALIIRGYEAPQGEIETTLAQIWQDLLGLQQVGRHDQFFELGGHSLLAVTLIERMRQVGLSADVRVLFSQPTLAALAAAVGGGTEVLVPANLITEDCKHITPDMLPLADLDQNAIDRIVASVQGGISNVQDIYALAPLQEGILYHHLMAPEDDPYRRNVLFSFDSRERVQHFAKALQAVIARHDILRTSLLWEGLDQPVQVVWRQAGLIVEELRLDPATPDIIAQLHSHDRVDIRQAPMLRIAYAHDPLADRWVALLAFHHLIHDATSLPVLAHEIDACMLGQEHRLPASVPYRNYVAQARLGVSREDHEAFFRDMLGDIDEPTLPFDLHDVQGDGGEIEEVHQRINSALSRRLRAQARQSGVSAASLVHLAWAQVLGKVTGRDTVVFGTVLMGRMSGSAGTDRALGMFINTLPIRIDIGHQGAQASVHTTHARLSTLLKHEHASLSLAQRCSGVSGELPLFSALLNYRHSGGEASNPEANAAWTGIQTLGGEERSNYPLMLNVDDLGEDFMLNVQAVVDIDAQRVCAYMQTALTSLVEALEHSPLAPLHSLPILPEQERNQLIVDFNATERLYPQEALIHTLFEQQAERQPDACAVSDHNGKVLTYAELNHKANQLAHQLIERGIGPDDRVAVRLHRSTDMVVALLAILKAGGAYMPIDPDLPASRQYYMLDDSAPVALLTAQALLDFAAPSHLPVLLLDNHDAQRTHHPTGNPRPTTLGLEPTHLAYVLYTSGSTGLPKGVMNEHRGVVNRLLWAQNHYAVNETDRVLQKTPYGFDVSVWEFFLPLLAGAQLHLARPGGHQDPAYLAHVMREQRITLLHFVPSMLEVFLEHGDSQGFADLRRVLCSGEALPGHLVRRFKAQLPDTALHNLYGPTEAAVDVTAWDCSGPDTPDSTPIGKPIANTRLYLLDAYQQPVPLGVAGEVYIAGVQVARGYLNLTQLTAERFLDDPFSQGPGARMYKTGDLGRYLPDGNIEFLGRNDDQVKIRGLRIELGEIEARLAQHHEVKEVVMMAREDASGEKRLVAYYTSRLSGETLDIEVLRLHLQAHLPDYMVPAAYVCLASLPLTSNGKLDRKALPAPDQWALVSREYQAPQGATERAIAEIWQELLGIDEVGRQDHFFELGGHSLLAVKLIERMRQIGLSADVRVLFSQPTLTALAAAVGGGTEIVVPTNLIPEHCERITPDMLPLVNLDQDAIDRIVSNVPGGVGNVQDIYALAPLQEGILYHHLAAERGDPYVLKSVFALQDQAYLEAFSQALQQLIQRHDILRTALLWEGLEEPVQVVWRQAALSVETLDLDPMQGDISLQLQQRHDPRHSRLDLTQAPLMRLISAYDAAHQRIVSLLLCHHLVLDHTALQVMRDEMQALMSGKGKELPASVPYRNYVAQARLGVSREDHEAFFRDMLGDIDEPTLPFDLHDVQGDGGEIEEVHQRVDSELARRLRYQARSLGVSAASLCHLAWAQVLGKVTGQDTVVFGTVLMGRMQGGDGADRALGMFINTLPIRIDVGNQEVQASAQATHAQLATLLKHEHAPLSLAQRCSGVSSERPLFSALLNYRHSNDEVLSPEADAVWAGIQALGGEERSNYPLMLNVDDLGEDFMLNAQVVADIGAQRVCDYMHAAIESLVKALEDAPSSALNTLPILPQQEMHKLLVEFNATALDYPQEQTLHGLFEAQVERTPEAVAVVHDDVCLSYRELNRRANQLAHHLRDNGVKPDSRVAICVERGPEMIVGLLAILKAGGAYVPLDPAYPAERIAYMLEDSAPAAVLAQDATVELLADAARVVINLDNEQWQDESVLNPLVPELTSAHLAYVIYTSGSTGLPKGVMIEHRNTVNFLTWAHRTFDAQTLSKTLFSTSLNFDLAVYECFAPLTSGGSIEVVANVLELQDGEHDVTLINTVPSALKALLESGGLGEGVDTVNVAGEALKRSLVETLFEQTSVKRLCNLYGPSETTTYSSWVSMAREDGFAAHIGKPVANTQFYLLDEHKQPVPLGVPGELYIGGAGVARGYLNRDDLTAERFLKDPFSSAANARMYKTGDLGRWLADGNIEFLGRNDDQVKIRGFRIELGEIEAKLAQASNIKETVVLAREDVPGDKRLVAYFTADAKEVNLDGLREHLLAWMPSHMVPAAYVQLDALPLTPNGKLDRKALPAPDLSSVISREYEAPVGETETVLAQIWTDLLQVERVGRQDHFFELGGHSLLAVKLIERMRQIGLSADVRVLFSQPTLTALAAAVGGGTEIVVPTNLIPEHCERITPDMLPLVNLDQDAIDRIVSNVPGGVGNVQDIYALAPLQEGILYHHLAAERGDPYVLKSVFALQDQAYLEAFSQALQQLIQRHDILRTALLWEGLEEPVQVVWRQAALSVETLDLDPMQGDISLQLQQRHDPRHSRLDLTQAPLMRLISAYDAAHQRIVSLLLCHHLVLDHTALQVMRDEMQALMSGKGKELPASVPYRNYVAQARLGVSREDHEAFFRDMLGDIDEPTLPFDLHDVQGDGGEIEEVHQRVDSELARRLRYQARSLGVSAASLCHLAWAQVLGKVTGQDTVVFGTVLMGRMQGGDGADRALGMFINTLPLRVDLGSQGVRNGVQATHARLTALLGHEHASLVLAQRCSGVSGELPLFSALLNYRHSGSETPNPETDAVWSGIQTLGGEERSNYPLTLNVDDLGEDFMLNVQAVVDIGAQRVCDYVQTALESLITALEDAPSSALNALPILPAAEREQLLVAFNATALDYPQEQTLHGLFEAQVEHAPEAVAVVHGDVRLSYRELNQRANQLAHHLRDSGVKPDSRVAICVERGPEMIIGLLAILKAGAGYVPLDPAYPAERLAFLLDDSEPVAVLVQEATRERLADASVPIINLDDAMLQRYPVLNPQVPELTPAHLAYVIYTSGSTGLPKGVQVEHRNVARLFSATQAWFDFNPTDVWALFHSFAFDFSVWEIWGALVHGGQLLIVPQPVTRSPQACYTLICDAGVTVLNQTPSAFRQLIAAQGESQQAHSLRQVIFGGEALDPGMLKPWYAKPANAATQLVNMYGITETTVHVTYYPLQAEDAQQTGISPIGVRIPDLQTYVLDAQRQPVPMGVVGELYVGGAGVARGYLNRPELNEERFIADPFSPNQGARLYRTGDLVRWSADGSLEYRGRNDDQVKIRGFRIELGEIEAQLAACTGVREAVAVAREDVPGDKRLVAYIIPQDDTVPSASDLRAQLQQNLAEHMLPGAFVTISAWPLTSNGKLDRKALPVPGLSSVINREYEAPVGETETALAQIWTDLLQLERVGRHDHFFELGGHSLLAVKLIERMRQIGLSADVRVLFSQPTLKALAAAVGGGTEIVVPTNLIPEHCERITPDMLPLADLDQDAIDRIVSKVPGGVANVQDIYALAPLQEGIFYHHLAAERGDPYVLKSVFALQDQACLEAFSQALQQLIQRHDILRTALLWEGLDEPVQVVWRQAALSMETLDLDPMQGDISLQLQQRHDPRHSRLDLTQAPLMRLVSAYDAPHQRIVSLLLCHHLVLDHTALQVMRDEMQALMSGKGKELPASVPYRNYVAQARLGVSREDHEAFFRDMLGDIDEPTLPFDLHDVQGDGGEIEEVHQRIDSALSRRLRVQARQSGVSAASLVHLAWAQVLGKITGKGDVVFGTVLMGRMQGGEGTDRAIGMFINTLPLRVNLAAQSVRTGVKSTHGKLTALLAHEHASLALAQRCSGVSGELPLFSSLLNYRHNGSEASNPEADAVWAGIQPLGGEERSNYPLTLNVDDLGEDFMLNAQVVVDIGAQRVCNYMLTALASLVEALEHSPLAPLHSLSILPEQERHQLIVGFNATEDLYPQDALIHTLFEQQAERQPDACAVSDHNGKILTYAELNHKANQLAHQLIEQGIGPDDRVAICVERGPEMIIGLLAILKAGAGYVPLDPAYPAERLAFLLDDSEPVAVLVQEATRKVLITDAVPIINLDDAMLQHYPVLNPQLPELTPAHLAYVIYTSGSTGLPKGVQVEHRNVARLFSATQAWFDFNPTDVWALFHSFAFDFSVWEIWGALVHGGQLLIVPQPVTRSPQACYALICDAGVTVLNQTPSAFRQLIAAQGESQQVHSLRQVIFGGEALDPGMLKPWYAKPANAGTQLVNMYGITETTVHVTYYPLQVEDAQQTGVSPIGVRIPDLQTYVLDAQRQPVPMGVVGELYVGGAGVARGYLNRPELNEERFIADPFSDNKSARLYRTGDLTRWSADGSLEYRGRNDDQVKIRGFRIELGEIEAELARHEAVEDAAVMAREDVPGDKRLVAYFTADTEVSLDELREHLLARMPSYMVPAAYVQLDALPLTPNGKLDRKALPAPDQSALISREYQAPQGSTEQAIAEIWQDLLGLQQVGRHDHFFELGGHSLLAVKLIERMRQIGLSADVRVLFSQPTLAALAAAVGSGSEIKVPANLIPEHCARITPDMLPLADLDQDAIDRIVSKVPGGVSNVQDIYALAPLQQGILYHHISAHEGDPYVLQAQFNIAGPERLDAFVTALQSVIDRHDILRTALFWEGLSEPAQVVMRKAALHLEEVMLDPASGAIAEQLQQQFDPRHYRLDLGQAPLMRLVYAQDVLNQCLVATLLFHHMALDHTAMEVVRHDMQAHLLGETDGLAVPMPYRNYVAQARLGGSDAEHEAFFRAMLGDIDEPTLPFDLHDVQGNGSGVEEVHLPLDASLSKRLRTQARLLGVSAASLHHLAWAQVLGKVTGKDDVVFGTVLMGRMNGGEGADRALGMFINTLPLRVNLGPHDVRSGVSLTHARLTALLGHEHASLALAQRCSSVPAPTPLFSALLNYRHSAVGSVSAETLEAWRGIETVHAEERTNYPLTLSLDDLGEGFGITVQAVHGIDAGRVCGYMHAAIESLIKALEDAPSSALNTLPILPQQEMHKLLVEFNATALDYPQEQTLHGLFQAQVERTPEAVAVVHDDVSLSYRELNQRANQLAHHLRGNGVGPDSCVAICVERGPEMIVGLLAILKAGGAYVPLDPAYPADRIAYMLRDSAPAAVLAQGATLGLLAGVSVPLIDLDSQPLQGQSVDNPRVPDLTSAHLAYVIYTSGSTGLPKGVMIEHRNTVNFLTWAHQSFDSTVLARTLFSTSLNFDLAVYECFAPLTSGGSIEVVTNVLELQQKDHDVTLINTVPSALQALLESGGLNENVHTVNVAGEALKRNLVERLFEQTSVKRLCNLYGPSETTTYSSWVSMDRKDGFVAHIGKPVANTRFYLLDAHKQPVPLGVPGEIHIGGAGVARGYLNRDDLTAERFLDDPFSQAPGARMYKTGDLGRWLADGNIEFLGRNDDQVKIRGFRIELGEIEAKLAQHEAVKEAVVMAREDVPGDKRLVAYFTQSEAVGIETLRNHLLAQLPEYMVPAAYVQLDALPLTPNSKLDRKALPAPDLSSVSRRNYAAPQGEVEIAIARIWQELLGVEQVGRHDHFFELGGHSLLAVTLIERMRQQNMSADVRVLFSQPTLATLAAAVGGGTEIVVPANLISEHCERITPDMLPLVDLVQDAIDRIVASVPGGVANVQDIYALAPLQQGILYHHISAQQGDPYVLQAQFRIEDYQRLGAFTDALQSVIDRHDILRTAVLWESLSEPVQVVWRHAALHLEEVHLDPAAGAITEQLMQRFDPCHHRLDVTQAPLMRLAYAQDVLNRRLVAVLSFHHMALDHTALDVVRHEMQAHLMGRNDQLTPAVPYRNYVAQVRLGASREKHEAFFTDMLGDVDEPTLPFGLHDVQGDGTHIEEAEQVIAHDLNRRLRLQARQLGVSAASLYHLAWAQVLAQVSGKDDVVFGTVLMGRLQGGDGADRALGMFINTLPLRVDLVDQGAHAGVKLTHARLTALLEHEHASLALAQRCSRVATSTPLFSALLNYRHSTAGTASAEVPDPWHGIDVLGGTERTNYPLTLNVDDLGDGFKLTVLVAGQVEAHRVCIYLQTALENLVEALEHSSRVPLHSLSILPEQERNQLIVDFNATALDYPQEQTLHGLFEAQVERTPEAVAVVHDDARLSYRELNRRANQLAHHLRDCGVGPDARVAICVERGPEMIVGLLAILKAGGAYVPLDPVYPAERIAYMLQDSAPTAVLAQGTTLGLLAGVSVPLIDLDSQSLQDQSVVNPLIPDLTSSHLAYVIYTSGSTGLPKGVMIEHRNTVNFLIWAHQSFDSSVLAKTLFSTSLNFDLAVYECFAPLTSGGSIEVVTNVLELQHGEHDITLINTVPSALKALLESGGLGDGVDTVNVAGEALKRSLVETLFEQTSVKRLCNLYGPSETTTYSSWVSMAREDGFAAHIGKPVANTQFYLLDEHKQPVPLGVPGEIYIGGAGVARGYLNRDDLTAERFLKDPFSSAANARMYKTGDLGRYLPDGNIEYLGRNDDQVKIRGFRIELGEIEVKLAQHEAVNEAVVLAREDVPGDKRLVAYFTQSEAVDIEALRIHLQGQLPEYMVPVAYVYLDELPLTPNGKLDRKALPVPDLSSVISREYEAPQGEVEIAIARIWQELLDIDQVGRHDHFFELGGHSLLAVTLIERMRQVGLSADVRVLFSQPTLAALAAAVGSGSEIVVPTNLIPEHCERITPDMLPLADLDQDAIDRIVSKVPGGVANVQDIYALAPLQEGILYHHLAAERGDPYVLKSVFALQDQACLEAFSQALQQLIQRHDILRTALLWEGLEEPVQVVWHQAALSMETLDLDPMQGDISLQLQQRHDPRHSRLDLTQAPLMRLISAYDAPHRRIVSLLLCHHLVLDHTALQVMRDDMRALMSGKGKELPASVPYRNYVAQARLGVSREDHEAFFRDMLGDIDEPTLPFDLHDVQGDGGEIDEVHQHVDTELARRLRYQARSLGVSAASLCHLAWAQVLGKVTGQDTVVFGTVLMGRMQGGDGADRALGMFINTLPLRVDLGSQGVRNGVQKTHARLTALLGHEHASLVLAQRCSGVSGELPLFSVLLNYRHSGGEASNPEANAAWTGIQTLGGEERSNYPLMLNVDDLGEDFMLNVQAVVDIDAQRVCAYMQTALTSLVEALEHSPLAPLHSLPILPEQERNQLIVDFNATERLYPQEALIHTLFEQQAERQPDACAVSDHNGKVLTYAELNHKANQLAHQLIERASARMIGWPCVCTAARTWLSHCWPS
ncbi:non-ribosomal peptide synthase/polyketide synthase [Pseudomonas sp. B21-028]|uniref:non-ribosomal peptide synthase/polyketide synthase n=1 Tax=Pseudomonas sp. B21-028 TaxID=2895480 RepID=UPI002852F24E|nr:non-ribosomal peptide synthase/polyketide synthase [Pseudomonas sp. B21-028]